MLARFAALADGFSDRSKGLFYSIVGVLVLTPDSLLIRQCNAPVYTALFYRNLIFAFVMTVGLLVSENYSYERSINKLKALGKWGFITGVIFGASLWFIVVSLQNTAAASTLVIQASNPVFAAIFSYYIMGEVITKLTFATSVTCILAIVIIFVGSLVGGATSGKNDMFGLVMAVASSASFGLYIALLRWLSVYQA
jgi:drug/metabolite transporter (DMT)-like permease